MKTLERIKLKEKKAALAKTSTIKFHKLDWLEWVAIAISLWFLIYPHPYTLLFTIVLALPIVGLLINGVSKPSITSLVSISKENGKRKYDVADFIEFPGLVIMIRVLLDFEFESFFSILKVGTIALILLIILLAVTHKDIQESKKRNWAIYFAIVGNIAIYSYAGSYGANCVYDNSEPKVYEAKVIDKSTSRGSRGRTTHYLKVTPWGHHKDPEKIKVSRDQYESIKVGETTSIVYKKGLLGIPWYYVR